MRRIIFCILIIMFLFSLSNSFAETISIFAEYNSFNDLGAGIQLFIKDFALEGIFYPCIEADGKQEYSVGNASAEFDGYSINGLYFFNQAKMKNGPYTGIPYAGLGYLTFSGEAESNYYNPNDPLQTTGSANIEFTWEYLNLFGGYRWGNRIFY